MTAVSNGKVTTKEMALIGVMTAITCVIAPFSIPLPISPVPITLGTLALYYSVYLLGTKNAFVSCFLYLLTGFLGMPVFSGFTGGFGRLAGPTGGYMIGYLLMILVSGSLLEKGKPSRAQQALSLAAGTAVCYLFGTIWLCLQMDLDFAGGLSIAVLPYLPFDFIKILLTVMTGPVIARRVKRAL